MLAHANHEINEVYVAEITTHLRQDGIDQILDHLRLFPRFFPDHRGKKLYGISPRSRRRPTFSGRSSKRVST